MPPRGERARDRTDIDHVRACLELGHVRRARAALGGLLRRRTTQRLELLTLAVLAARLEADFAAMLRHANAALRIAATPRDRLALGLHRVEALCHLRRFGDAERSAALLAEEARDANEPLLEAMAESRRGLVAAARGDRARATAAYRRFVTLMRKCRIDELLPEHQLHYAGVLHELGEIATACERFETIARGAEERRDWDTACSARAMYGAALLESGDVQAAARELEAAIALGDSRSSPGVAAYACFCLGMAHEHAENRAAASAAHTRGLAIDESRGSTRSLLAASRAFLAAQGGDRAAAAVSLRTARAAAARATVPSTRASVELRAAMCDCALGKRGSEARLRRHLAELDETATQSEVRLVLPLARRLLAQRTAERVADRHSLRVASDGAWFERDGSARVRLSGVALRRMLVTLATAAARGSAALHWTDLASAAWSSSPTHAAFDRVRTSVRRLRAAGLGEVLERTHDGYRIAANTLVELVATRA